MLLCLLLAAKSSVGAVLAFADLPAFGGQDFDLCPLVAPAEHAVSLGASEDAASHQSAGGDVPPPLAQPPHHHHSCSTHCLMPGLVATSMTAAPLSPANAPWPELAVPASAVSLPLLHPPRARG